jgi:hypothetical protein
MLSIVHQTGILSAGLNIIRDEREEGSRNGGIMFLNLRTEMPALVPVFIISLRCIHSRCGRNGSRRHSSKHGSMGQYAKFS